MWKVCLSIYSATIAMIFLAACIGSSETDSDRDTTISPIKRLMNGNERYMTFHAAHPHQTLKRMIEISREQNPFAIVVSCSDSRVPPEIIFDQGLGDLFVIRTAGNVIGEYELGSMEYAIQNLNCQVIVVLGHDGCGAIQTFIDQPLDSLPGHMNKLINFIRSQPNANIILEKSEDKYYHEVINNIIYGVNLIKQNSGIANQKFNSNELEIYGAVYHMQYGSVQIIADEINH